MNLMMVTPIYPPRIGGPATQSFHLSNKLAQVGHKVTVVTFAEKAEVKIENDNLTVYRLPWSYGWGVLDKGLRWLNFPRQFIKLLNTIKPQVVVCHSVSLPMMMAGFICRRRHVPRVIKFAGDWVYETLNTKNLQNELDFKTTYQSSFKAKLLFKVERWGLKQFNVLWAVSKFRKSNLLALLPQAKNIWLQKNCLTLPPKRTRASSLDIVKIISASRFVPHKRLEVIIDALCSLSGDVKKRLQVTFIGGGDINYAQQIKDYAQQRGILDLITFTGIIDDQEKIDLMLNSDIYISASREEGFPNVMIEALGAGLPIISTNVGGVSEIVIEGYNGLLIPVDNIQAMAEAIKKLVTNNNLRQQMSNQALVSTQVYDLDKNLPNFVNLYQDLIDKKF